MADCSSLVFSGIAPHPPIMVPEVGRESIAEVKRSIAGMAELTRRIIDSEAQSVVLISPHAPLDPSAFVAYTGTTLFGDFRDFRAPSTRIEAPLDQELLNAIRRRAQANDFEILAI